MKKKKDDLLIESNNYENNAIKVKLIQEIWYKANQIDGEKEFAPTKTNLMRNEEVENAKPGTFEDYKDFIEHKVTPRISKTEISLMPNETFLSLIFWHDTAALDTSNYAARDYEDLKQDILDTKASNEIMKDFNHNGKIAVFMTNVIGLEWKLINALNSINIVTSEEQEVFKRDLKRIFFGLSKRKQRVVNDIKSALRSGADEIYLMKGLHEHYVEQLTGRDIFDIIVNELNDSRVKYIREGTETTVKFVKHNKKPIYNTIRFINGLKTRSPKASQLEALNRSVKEDITSATFVCSGNNTAAKEHTKEYYPAGQARLKYASKGTNPEFRENRGNVYKLFPVANGDISIVAGNSIFLDENWKLLQEVHNERKKTVALSEIAIEKINEQVRSLMNSPIKVKSNGNGGKNEHGKNEQEMQ